MRGRARLLLELAALALLPVDATGRAGPVRFAVPLLPLLLSPRRASTVGRDASCCVLLARAPPPRPPSRATMLLRPTGVPVMGPRWGCDLSWLATSDTADGGPRRGEGAVAVVVVLVTGDVVGEGCEAAGAGGRVVAGAGGTHCAGAPAACAVAAVTGALARRLEAGKLATVPP